MEAPFVWRPSADAGHPMSYGSLWAVPVSLAVEVLAGIILGVVEERYATISVNLLRLAAWMHPARGRDEFIDEALGNLGEIDDRYRTICHAMGLVIASGRIRHRQVSWMIAIRRAVKISASALVLSLPYLLYALPVLRLVLGTVYVVGLFVLRFVYLTRRPAPA